MLPNFESPEKSMYNAMEAVAICLGIGIYGLALMLVDYCDTKEKEKEKNEE